MKNQDEVKIIGHVVSGRGKASHMVEDFRQELNAIVGCALFAGSLNLYTEEPYKLDWRKGNVFKGGKKCIWPAKINDYQVWLYRAKTMPHHIIEVLSERHLRSELELSDEDRLEVFIKSDLTEHLSIWETFWWRRLWAGKERRYYTDDDYVRFAKKVTKRLMIKYI